MSATESLADLYRLREDLKRLEPEVRTRVRRAGRAAGEEMLREAKRAAGYSGRIPSAIKLRISTSSRRPGVTIYASGRAAPHARPLEGIVRPTFRHPVFHQKDRRVVWVEQRSRPFLLPAAEVGRDALLAGLRGALDDALGATGL